MSFLDRIAAAVAPAASDEDRAEARRKIESMARGEPFAETVVSQHKEIEALFAEARGAQGGAAAHQAVRQLATLLTGHSNAEEAVLYPDLAEFGGKTQAAMAYEEHAMTKVQLAKLQRMEPGSKEWREKLDHIESAVQQHVYQEENSWLPDIITNTPQEIKAELSRRYHEELERYFGEGSMRGARAAPELA